MSAFKKGDVFDFTGLEGTEDVSRVITIIGVSVSGKLSFTIAMPDEKEQPHHIHDISYSEAQMMVYEEIWRPRSG